MPQSKATTTKKNGDREIPLTEQEYADLKRALLWPEEREHYDKVAKPTNLTELPFIEHGGSK